MHPGIAGVVVTFGGLEAEGTKEEAAVGGGGGAKDGANEKVDVGIFDFGGGRMRREGEILMD